VRIGGPLATRDLVHVPCVEALVVPTVLDDDRDALADLVACDARRELLSAADDLDLLSRTIEVAELYIDALRLPGHLVFAEERDALQLDARGVTVRSKTSGQPDDDREPTERGPHAHGDGP